MGTVLISLVLAMSVKGDDEEPIGFCGYITSGGSGVDSIEVKIMKGGEIWQDTTNDSGYFETEYLQVSSISGDYQLLLNGELCEEKPIEPSDFTNEQDYPTSVCRWDYEKGSEIPEFQTIAIPTAIVIGIVFLMQRKKSKL